MAGGDQTVLLTLAKAFVQPWISRFGVLSTITTDRGGQFKSNLWKAFTQLLGTKHTPTTSLPPHRKWDGGTIPQAAEVVTQGLAPP